MDLKRLRAEVTETHVLVTELRQKVLELRADSNDRLRRSVRERYRLARAQTTGAKAPSRQAVLAKQESKMSGALF